MFRKSAVLIVALFCMGLLAFNLSAAEKPLRISAKIGTPNLAGLGVEYVLPAMDGRLAANLDFSFIPLSVEENLDMSLMYWGIGANYFLTRPGSGLYAGLGFGRLSVGIKETDIYDYSLGMGGGEAEASLGLNLIQIKAGYRAIWGAFSLVPELGYGIGSMDDAVSL